ncbi:hypothetical protein BTO06_00415 [Tenacibaculum sp. SZ-18]|uniref:sacsin N-terminal ATP-binding-like domain-containing protein n=1 Tax=Tenacibaculum sp. SZ-18 TaxID=754423 RepID=UPI000C2D5DAA|nr:DUF3883 domain-containing protein [Tenacibaculum sp. SZ-18]AUC13700.1 hypothetical protein BTO06_00415 [Tenacibaculum sp. SZ-18]
MQEDRDQLIEKTRKEDERSDLKQHADGMLRDFEKFNKNSSNRAIWELVQNACDLTTQCKIEIDYRDNLFSFSHNGKAFTTKTLISLVKQVSGKYGDEDITEVGKYGTGFLTTHTFGRKFKLNSYLDADGYYLPIKDFEIDRTPKIWQDLSDNISDQKKRVYDLLEKESAVEVSALKTTFTYLPHSEKEREYIKESSKYLDDYIPLVFTINDRLKEVVIHQPNGAKDTYQFHSKQRIKNDKGIELHQSILLKNNEEIHLFSIRDEEEEIEIILPINKNNEVIQFNENIARLFYYYPLIGSEDFGLNFIINCNKFLPTEPRDTIHLKSDKDQVKADEEANRLIIEKCSSLIFSFLRSNIIEVKNPLLYTNVNFRTDRDDIFLNEYFTELSNKWNSELSELPFVKTNDGYKSINNVSYLSEDFLNTEDDLFDCFYELISKFYSNIPVKEDIVKWSEHAINWSNESTNFITHSDLLEKISECSLQDFNETILVQYYKHIIDFVDIAYFNDLDLIPNIEGNFNKIGVLLKPDNLNDTLIELGKVLIPVSVSKLIHPAFHFSFSINLFNRRNFSDEVKNSLDEKNIGDSIFYPEELNNELYHYDLVETKNKVEASYFKSLLEFCKLTNSTDSISKPNQLLKKISTYYNWDESLLHLPSLSEDSENIESRSTRKVLIKIFCNLIALHNNNWVKENTAFLSDLCSLYDDSYKEVYKESKIYPNQLFELHLAEDLKRDKGVDEDIKLIYLSVIAKDINEVLVISDFNAFLPDDYINNRSLTTTIEETLFQDNISDIENHPFKTTILKIIPLLTEQKYQHLFPQLNDKKASIMISVVSKEETKEDIFSIVTLDDEKIKNIGDLVRKSNFEEILNKALESIEDENQRKANFQFKHQIGTHIEEKLKEHLKQLFQPEDIKCEVLGEQDGQDIVIKIKDEIKYYIEVKSRWDKRTSIKMSRNQTLRSNEHHNIYALCSVDMTDYHEEDRFEISDINKILDNIKFVNNIGEKVEHLVEVFEQTKQLDEIHLDGDYRTLVPQKVIEAFGLSFRRFEDYLIASLKSTIHAE